MTRKVAEVGTDYSLSRLPSWQYIGLVNRAYAMPLLKWVGGKSWFIPRLLKLYHPHQDRRLVDLFCGGLSVPLGLQPECALLNDKNPHLVNLYRWLGKGLQADLSFVNNESLYYVYRDRFNSLAASGEADTAEAALLFYYLNRTGYRGLCRFNQSGQFNVPFGGYPAVEYVTDFSPWQAAYTGWEFTNHDFEDVELQPDDFVYADPPYDVPFTEYVPGGFSWADQVRLAAWLARHPGPVVISNQSTPRIRELYRRLGYKLEYLRAPRRIGGVKSVPEVVAVRNLERFDMGKSKVSIFFF